MPRLSGAPLFVKCKLEFTICATMLFIKEATSPPPSLELLSKRVSHRPVPWTPRRAGILLGPYANRFVLSESLASMSTLCSYCHVVSRNACSDYLPEYLEAELRSCPNLHADLRYAALREAGVDTEGDAAVEELRVLKEQRLLNGETE